ncbi:phage major capsid protein [Salmonella enterica subsp. salamae]|nr:phage major capsid protein [Salmonella enterica subsp. salamae]ECJ2281393.1 phage major capsid protein [Salmonella enterica subsp. salamae]
MKPKPADSERQPDWIGQSFTRSATPQQLPDFNRDSLTRTMEVRSVDMESRTVELAFSSEEEVPRWYGVEILDHSPDSVRMERLNDGAALLMDHDWTDQIGSVIEASIDTDRRGRSVVKFSRSARASEILQDVADKIRQKVSVGYRVHAAQLEETRDGNIYVYRITDWEPYEISFVSVPADNSVGVGRTAENLAHQKPEPPETGTEKKVRTMNEKTLRDNAGNLVRAMVDAEGNITQVLEVLERAGEDARQAEKRGIEAEKARTRTIGEMGETYGARDLAMKAITDGVSVDAFQRQLLDHLNSGERKKDKDPAQPAGNKPLADAGARADTNIGMSPEDIRRYSIFNVVRALANPLDRRAQEAVAFELECSAAAEKQYGRSAQGIMVPDDVLRHFDLRTFSAGTATSGGNLIATDLLAGSFIDLLRPRSTIMSLAASMGGLVGNVAIPKQTGGATAYWIGEGADAQSGQPTTGQVTLTPHTIGAYTDITRQLLLQSTPDAEMLVRNDLLSAIALGIDLAGYYGTGASSQPTGIVNITGVNAVTFAATNPTFDELVAMETAIATDNADVAGMSYVVNAKMRGYAKTTPKFASGTSVASAGTIWEPNNQINGYGAQVTNQISDGDVIFGNFSDLIVGMWGGLDLNVDDKSLSKSGGLRLVVLQDVDFAVRHEESFCVGRKAAESA